MKTSSLNDFYREISASIPDEISREIGHFNWFSTREMAARLKEKPVMPYNRREYYKISLIRGRNRAEYADKVIEIEDSALLFATPHVPYHWVPKDDEQDGYFCIFTADFLMKEKSGVDIDNLPLFKPGGYPVFRLTDDQINNLSAIFLKMEKELASDYIYKYDLLRNYVLELIHFGQKLQPVETINPTHTAASRMTSLFIELLERQFPIDSTRQRLRLRTAGDYAGQLSVHVNHLNRVLKENTGKTTSEIISNRVAREAKILLKHTDWNISEVAYALGFEEPAHFSNFFKKQTSFTPLAFRS